MAEVIRTIGDYVTPSEALALLDAIRELALAECGEEIGEWLLLEVDEDGFNENTSDPLLQNLIDEIRMAVERWAIKNDQQPKFVCRAGIEL
jgi:hypothetical protein